MQYTPEKIDADFYRRLQQHWSDEEIVELGSFIGFNIGYHTFFRTLDFYPMFSPDGRLISQEESRRIYGDSPVSHLSSHVVAAVEAASEGGPLADDDATQARDDATPTPTEDDRS